MSFRRLNARLTNLSRVGVATLYHHDLRFHKISHSDGSCKCVILQTYNSENSVVGVVYKIDPSEKHILDAFEGRGCGYEEKQVCLHSNDEPYVNLYIFLSYIVKVHLCRCPPSNL